MVGKVGKCRELCNRKYLLVCYNVSMSVWATRRQLSFILSFILLLILTIVVLIVFNRHIPSCTDNEQNQGELSVGFGGPCLKVCSIETRDLIVLWTRVFPVREGIYDVVAFVENPNPFGLSDLAYRFRLFDNENVSIKDIVGHTFVNPHERFLIFESNVNVGFRSPTRAFIEIISTPKWLRLSDIRRPDLTISNQRNDRRQNFSVAATLVNNSSFDANDIEISAILFDNAGNAIHASRTWVASLGSADSSDIIFTWPVYFASSTASADILSRVNLVDAYRSDEDKQQRK